MNPEDVTVTRRELLGDQRLPGARLLGDRRQLSRWLRARGLTKPGADPIGIEILKYRPGRRIAAIVKLGPGRARLMIKGYRRNRAGSVTGTYRSLEAGFTDHPIVRLPELLFTDSETGVLVWKYERGVPVISERARMPRRDLYRPRLSAVGKALARIHASPVKLDRRWGKEEEIGLLRERVQAGPPGAAVVARPICRALASGRSPSGLIHRDFYAQQIIEIRGRRGGRRALAVVDWDDSAMGPAALDLGNALAHLELIAIRRPALAGAVAEMRSCLVRGYRREWDRLAGCAPAPGSRSDRAPDEWATWEASALLRLSTLAWDRHRGLDRVWRAPHLQPLSGRSAADEARALLELAAMTIRRQTP